MWLGLEPWGLEAKIQALKPERGGAENEEEEKFSNMCERKGAQKGTDKVTNSGQSRV